MWIIKVERRGGAKLVVRRVRTTPVFGVLATGVVESGTPVATVFLNICGRSVLLRKSLRTVRSSVASCLGTRVHRASVLVGLSGTFR